MYDRILVAIDPTPTEDNRSALQRTEQIGKLTGATVYVLHVARGHIIPTDVSAGSGLGVLSAEDDAEGADRQAVQQLVDRLSAAGVEAHGEMVVSATEHDIADVILQRAKELDADLIVLGHQHHRGPGGFRSSVAENVTRQHPPCSILLARPPH